MSEEDYLFFFSEKSENGCFSNWYPSVFCDKNIIYYNMEQYMMYQKALLFDDMEIAAKILKNSNPMVCKKLGRQVKNFDPMLWSSKCAYIVTMGCLLKFNQNADIKQLILATNDYILVEASPYDRIWGIGYSASDALKVDKIKWGQNLLGKCLMKVRDILNKQSIM
jgi:ribA/ribD-fused uncharacterized protein